MEGTARDRRSSMPGPDFRSLAKSALKTDLAKFQQKKAEDENKPLADDTFNGLPLRFLKRTLKLVETADLHALCACSPKTLLSVISCPVQLRVNPRRLLPEIKWICKRRGQVLRDRDRPLGYLDCHCYPKDLEGIEPFFWNIHHFACTERDIVTDSNLGPLRHLPNLQSLDLRLCTGISGEGLEYILLARNLQALDLGWCMSLSEACVSYTAKLPVLETLDLSYVAGVNDAVLKELATAPSLVRLDLRGCANVSGAGMKSISQAPVLRSLNLKDCFQLSDSDLVPINDLIIRNRCTVYGRDGAVLYGLVVERKGAARISQLMHRREQPPFMFYAEDLRTVLNRHGLSEFSSVVETIRDKGNLSGAPKLMRHQGPTGGMTMMGVANAARALSRMNTRAALNAQAFDAIQSARPRWKRAARASVGMAGIDTMDSLDAGPLSRAPTTAGGGLLPARSIYQGSPTGPVEGGTFVPVGFIAKQVSMAAPLPSERGTADGSGAGPGPLSVAANLTSLMDAVARRAVGGGMAPSGSGEHPYQADPRAPSTSGAPPDTLLKFDSVGLPIATDPSVSAPQPQPQPQQQQPRGAAQVQRDAERLQRYYLEGVAAERAAKEAARPRTAQERRLPPGWRGGILQMLRSSADDPPSVVAAQMLPPKRPQSAWQLHPGDPVAAFPIHLLVDDDGAGVDPDGPTEAGAYFTLDNSTGRLFASGPFTPDAMAGPRAASAGNILVPTARHGEFGVAIGGLPSPSSPAFGRVDPNRPTRRPPTRPNSTERRPGSPGRESPPGSPQSTHRRGGSPMGAGRNTGAAALDTLASLWSSMPAPLQGTAESLEVREKYLTRYAEPAGIPQSAHVMGSPSPTLQRTHPLFKPDRPHQSPLKKELQRQEAQRAALQHGGSAPHHNSGAVFGMRYHGPRHAGATKAAVALGRMSQSAVAVTPTERAEAAAWPRVAPAAGVRPSKGPPGSTSGSSRPGTVPTGAQRPWTSTSTGQRGASARVMTAPQGQTRQSMTQGREVPPWHAPHHPKPTTPPIAFGEFEVAAAEGPPGHHREHVHTTHSRRGSVVTPARNPSRLQAFLEGTL